MEVTALTYAKTMNTEMEYTPMWEAILQPQASDCKFQAAARTVWLPASLFS